MRSIRSLTAAAVAVVIMAAMPVAPAIGSERDSWLGERTGFGEPLRFRAANGGAFRPDAVIVSGKGGAVAAKLPRSANVRSENRVDLSGTAVLGQLFAPTLDVASVREGAYVGPVYRVGDTLLVEAGTAPVGLESRRVAISTNIPRYGAISYDLGRLGWVPVTAPTGSGVRVGTAHVVGGALVLASQGGEPAYPSLEALFNDLF